MLLASCLLPLTGKICINQIDMNILPGLRKNINATGNTAAKNQNRQYFVGNYSDNAAGKPAAERMVIK